MDHKRCGSVARFDFDVQARIIGFFCQYKTLPGYGRWTLSNALQYFQEHPIILGEETRISRSSLHRLLTAHALKPHRSRYFLHISDPNFFQKMEKIIETYRTVSQHLYCFDECTGLQALERLHPDTSITPGKTALREVEYIRHGTVSIFSVLEVATGKAVTQVIPDHTSATVVAALKCHVQQVDNNNEQIHYICDNYGSHSTMEMCQTVAELCTVTLPNLPTVEDRRRWLGADYKRIVFHFLPFHGSWLNLIENWFGILQKGIYQRNVRSKDELAQTILDFTDTWNENYAHPFDWSYQGKELRGKTVRKLAYWVGEEATGMTAKVLSKQLDLMSNLLLQERCLVSKSDWEFLNTTIDEKSDYLEGVIRSINEIDFQKTMAKTEVDRQKRIREKIQMEKQNLHKKVATFRELLTTTLRLL